MGFAFAALGAGVLLGGWGVAEHFCYVLNCTLCSALRRWVYARRLALKLLPSVQAQRFAQGGINAVPRIYATSRQLSAATFPLWEGELKGEDDSFILLRRTVMGGRPPPPCGHLPRGEETSVSWLGRS